MSNKNKNKRNLFLIFIPLLLIIIALGTTFSVTIGDELNSKVSCEMPYSNSSDNECEIFLTLPEGKSLDSYKLTLSNDLVTNVKSEKVDLIPFDSKSFLEIDFSSSGKEERDYDYVSLYRLPVASNVYDYSISCSSSISISEDRDERGTATAGVLVSYLEEYPFKDFILCDYGNSPVSSSFRLENPCPPDHLIQKYKYTEYGEISTNIKRNYPVLKYSAISTSQSSLKISKTLSTELERIILEKEDVSNILLIGNSYLRTDVGMSGGAVSFPTCQADYSLFEKFDTAELFIGNIKVQDITFFEDSTTTVDISNFINSYCGRDKSVSLECVIPLTFKAKKGGIINLLNQSSTLKSTPSTIACTGCDGSLYSYSGSTCPVIDCSTVCYSCNDSSLTKRISDTFSCNLGESKTPVSCDSKIISEEYKSKSINPFIFLIIIVIIIYVIFRFIKKKVNKK